MQEEELRKITEEDFKHLIAERNKVLWHLGYKSLFLTLNK